MSKRLWPHAWEILAGLIIAGFSVLEDDGFHHRHPLHVTLSRRTALIPHAPLFIAVLGPVACWLYAWHVARLDPVARSVAPPPRGGLRPTH